MTRSYYFNTISFSATLTYFALVVKSYRDKMMMKIQQKKSPTIDTSSSVEPIQQIEQTANQEKQ